MYPIKFRAWHFQLARMFSADQMAADQMTLLPTGPFINVHSVSTSLSKIYPFNVMLPLQFTTLKDKHGTEIYVGDIVLSTYVERDGTVEKVYNEVVFQDAAFGYIGEVTGKFCNDLHEFAHETEVVGNIYQHKHLLEEPEEPEEPEETEDEAYAKFVAQKPLYRQ